MSDFVTRTWFWDCVQRSQDSVFSTVVNLTPELAAILLENNPSNRPASERRISLYSKDIQEGRWQFNGEPIIVSDDGLLNDGQHRCAAVVASQTPIQTLIVFGLSRDSRKTTNLGAAKTAGAFAAMDGMPYANTVSGAGRLVLSFDQTGSFDNASRISNTEIYDFVTQNIDDFQNIAAKAIAKKAGMAGMVAASVYAACYYICRRIDAEAADQFYHELATGEMLSLDDPAFVARNRLRCLATHNRAIKSEIIFRAWNAFRCGEKRTTIRVQGYLPKVA